MQRSSICAPSRPRRCSGATQSCVTCGDVVCYSRAQDYPRQPAARCLLHYPRLFTLEDAAAGEAHDVVEKSQGPMQRAVLVVDAGVYMAHVTRVDKLSSGLVVGRGPSSEGETGCRRSRVSRFLLSSKVPFHEEPRVDEKALVAKHSFKCSGSRRGEAAIRSAGSRGSRAAAPEDAEATSR